MCSSTWKALAFGAKLVNRGLFWRVGNGELIRLWTDNWVPDMGILLNHALVGLSDDMMHQTVNCYLLDGKWDIQLLALILPWNIIHRISSIHAGRNHSGHDRVIWGVV